MTDDARTGETMSDAEIEGWIDMIDHRLPEMDRAMPELATFANFLGTALRQLKRQRDELSAVVHDAVHCGFLTTLIAQSHKRAIDAVMARYTEALRHD